MLAKELTGAAMGCAVHDGAALKTDSHAAERSSRLAGDRNSARHARLEKCSGDDGSGLHLHGLAVDPDGYALRHARPAGASYAQADRERCRSPTSRPSIWSTSRRAAPGALVMPSPSKPAASHRDRSSERPAAGPMRGSLSAVAARKPVQTRSPETSPAPACSSVHARASG